MKLILSPDAGSRPGIIHVNRSCHGIGCIKDIILYKAAGSLLLCSRILIRFPVRIDSVRRDQLPDGISKILMCPLG